MALNGFRLIFPVLLMGLTGCIYTNNDVYTADPVAGVPATVNLITNLDPDNPNPYVDSLQVIYEFTIENGELYFVEALIEQYSFYELRTDYDPDTVEGPYIQSDTIWLHVNVPPDSGIYSMYLTYFYSPNTNSLGDILGIEADVLDVEYLVDFKGETP